MHSIKKLAEKTKKLTVIYAEDDERVQANTAKLLKRFFPLLEVFNDGSDAWDFFKDNQYDVLITDLNMPVLDGRGLIKNIKKHSSQTICIVMSGISDENHDLLEADYFLGKPTSLEELVEVLNEIVD